MFLSFLAGLYCPARLVWVFPSKKLDFTAGDAASVVSPKYAMHRFPEMSETPFFYFKE